MYASAHTLQLEPEPFCILTDMQFFKGLFAGRIEKIFTKSFVIVLR